jgi:hypothetical protein
LFNLSLLEEVEGRIPVLHAWKDLVLLGRHDEVTVMDWTEESNSLTKNAANNMAEEIKRLRAWLVRIAEGPCVFPMHPADGSKCDMDCARFMAKEAANGKRN